MRSFTSSSPARRTLRLAGRRARRRPAIIATALAVGLVATGGFTATTPLTAAQAAGSTPSFALVSYTAPAVDATLEKRDVDETTAALSAADATLEAADAVTADIAASGLDLGVDDTSIATEELEAAVDQLAKSDALASSLAAVYTDDVVDLADAVDERVASLRGSLDAAIARKAEEEAAAAEQARLEAEAAAAAAEAAAARPAAPAAPAAPVAIPVGGGTGDNSPAGAQASAYAMLGNYGWGDDQFGCLVSLWNKESGWNYLAHNGSSGAHGIPQALPGSKMASAGADWQTNAATQVAWGLGYIAGRYGSPCGAWGHSQSVGWY